MTRTLLNRPHLDFAYPSSPVIQPLHRCQNSLLIGHLAEDDLLGVFAAQVLNKVAAKVFPAIGANSGHQAKEQQSPVP